MNAEQATVAVNKCVQTRMVDICVSVELGSREKQIVHMVVKVLVRKPSND